MTPDKLIAAKAAFHAWLNDPDFEGELTDAEKELILHAQTIREALTTAIFHCETSITNGTPVTDVDVATEASFNNWLSEE